MPSFPDTRPVTLDLPAHAAEFLRQLRAMDAYVCGDTNGPDNLPLLAAWQAFYVQGMAFVMSKAYPLPEPPDDAGPGTGFGTRLWPKVA